MKKHLRVLAIVLMFVALTGMVAGCGLFNGHDHGDGDGACCGKDGKCCKPPAKCCGTGGTCCKPPAK